MQTKRGTAAESQQDEQAIRELVEKWLTASEKSDLPTMLNLLANDVIFMVPNKAPFGKEVFAQNYQQMKGTSIEGHNAVDVLCTDRRRQFLHGLSNEGFQPRLPPPRLCKI